MKKNKKKNKKTKEYNLLMYSLDSAPKIKKFDSVKELSDFIQEFNKDHPDHLSIESGDWIDYCVLGVTGPVHFFTDGLEVE